MAQRQVLLETPRAVGVRSGSVTRTIRIDRDLDAEINRMAEKERLSMNLLANKALRRYLEWEARADKFGFVDVSATILEKLFNVLTDEEARELGRWAAHNMIPEMTNFWFKKFNAETAFTTLDLIAKYGRPYRLERTSDTNRDIIVLKHDKGARASAYYAELLTTLFEGLDMLVESFETQDQVVATVVRHHPSFNGK